MAEKKPDKSEQQQQESPQESQRSADEEKYGIVHSPAASTDPAFEDDPANQIDPGKVVGRFAEQPDPNDERPAPLPLKAEGTNEAPADDEEGTPAASDPSAKVVEHGR